MDFMIDMEESKPVQVAKKQLTICIKAVPPSVNHIWKHTARGKFIRCYMTSAGKEFKNILAELVPKDFSPLNSRLKMNLTLTFPDKRRRDIDNYSKGILDALAPGVYADDSQIEEMHIYKRYDKGNPLIEIKIEEIGTNVEEIDESDALYNSIENFVESQKKTK